LGSKLVIFEVKDEKPLPFEIFEELVVGLPEVLKTIPLSKIANPPAFEIEPPAVAEFEVIPVTELVTVLEEFFHPKD
jgi:hypothetical protein